MTHTWHACLLTIKGQVAIEHHAFKDGVTVCAKSLTTDAPAEPEPPVELQCKHCRRLLREMGEAA